MTVRAELGAAASILFMKLSSPTPFWTTSWAALTSWVTLALDSKVCGSVLGLLRIAVSADVLAAELADHVGVLVLGADGRDGAGGARAGGLAR